MAPEKTNKKRKSGASIPSPSTKKIQKTEAPIAEETAAAKPQNTKAAAPKAKAETTASTKATRKRASDFFEAEEPAAEKAKAKSEKASKKSSKKRKSEPEPEPEPEAEDSAAAEEQEQESAQESENEKEDDQTAALLKGFESSDDEEDGEDEGFDADKVPTIPNEKKLRKKLSKAKGEEGKEGPGVVYVGRIPHGFYEHQMRAYFSQFGDITRLRLSRNKKTGRSKHYAFIEFAHASVARITAETMDKYLMFGHILQVRYIPADQVHPDLFKGANRRFKPAPRNKMEGRHLRLGMEREGWENRIKKEEQRRKEKEEKLKAMGYDFEAPAVKGVEAVEKKGALPAAEEAPKAITEKPHQETEVVKKVKPEHSKGVVTEKTTRRSKRISGGAVEEKVEEVKETKPAEKKSKAKSKPVEEAKASKGKTEKETKAAKTKDTKAKKAKASK
ncbi:hypothetical protein IWZ03DRAFT_385528 [Phyllosticta citriasiana]|uniref:RRM domain-containing protein n=1 Tax=Phyllosticta citriasiana TaxID=595635 RepID=A0ABR1KCA8_9PEZI